MAKQTPKANDELKAAIAQLERRIARRARYTARLRRLQEAKAKAASIAKAKHAVEAVERRIERARKTVSELRGRKAA